MKKILIIFLCAILMGCVTSKITINDYNNVKNIPVYLKSIMLTGPSLTDLDREIIEKNIRFDLSKNGLYEKDASGDCTNITVRVDARQIGYNIFLMTEVHNFYLEIAAFDKNNNPVTSIVSNNKIYYSPRDMNNLDIILSGTFKSFYNALYKKINNTK